MLVFLFAAAYLAGALSVVLMILMKSRTTHHKTARTVFIPPETPKENPLLSRFKYVCIPGNTNTGVFVSAAKLCNLYGVNRSECLCLTSADMAQQYPELGRWSEGMFAPQQVMGYDLRGLIPLTPSGDGKYEIPTEVIR